METLISASEIQKSLLAYYAQHARDLPWRHTRDPYAIWISEIMLQQTRVQTVVPRYREFLRRFPDVASLAAADERTVCEAWAGLGYYRRARQLHAAARKILDEEQGHLPVTETALRRLPGIGSYTAAAIASIAFGMRTPSVDGNLVRVLARLFALPGRAGDAVLFEAVHAQAAQLTDCDEPGQINQALMDLGATLCLPKTPACPNCPLRLHCMAFAQGRTSAYPGAKVRAPRKPMRVAFAWVTHRGAVLLEQRSLDGLWPGLWELPSACGTRAKADLGLRLGQPLGACLVQIAHTLTHRDVTARVYRATRPKATTKRQGQKWWRDPLSAPLSSLARKAIVAVQRTQILAA